MDILLLLRLLAAHLISDFVLQPSSWVENRIQNGGRSSRLYIHGLVTALIAYVFSGLYDNWIIPLVIFITHTGIDFIKATYGKRRFTHFIIDQIAHILVLIILWLWVSGSGQQVLQLLLEKTQDTTFWLVLIGYISVSWPVGILIGSATQKWRDQIQGEQIALSPEKQTTQEPGLGLANAGKWIGICERILILTFVLLGQYTAIGFLMTAKSILRFSEKEGNTQLKTEYVLVGTLLSFAIAAMIGVGVKLLLP